MDTTKLLLLGAGALAGFWAVRRRQDQWLEGKRVVITGGSKGLGFVLAREFGRRGCKVAICARDQGELDRAARRLEDEKIEVLAKRCDVSSPEQFERFVSEVDEHFGGVDVLVNNAGIIQVGPLDDLTVDDFELAMNTMFWGVLHPIRAVLPQMLERRDGRIVNITSIGGKISVPHLLPYSCAKFATVGLSEGLSAELRGRGVKVSTIVPGLMRTGSHINALFKGKQTREFAWFSLGASLPGVSMGVERAARQIVRSTQSGRSERILSIPAKVLDKVHALLPGATQRIAGAVSSLLLPSADGAGERSAQGIEVYGKLDAQQRKLLDIFTALGWRAARRYQN